MSTIKVNKIEKRSGSTLELGGPGTAVTLACGATQTGFGRTGTVDWCTTAKTSPFTAVSGDGFFVNTTSGGVTVTLPSSPSAGDIVSLSDYASTWAVNAVTLCRNGSKINGVCSNTDLNTKGQSITLIYVDGTRGWKNIQDSTSNVSGTPNFIVATGGTETVCGDYKIHTFNSDNTFEVDTAPTPANNKVSYIVVAGGGSGGTVRGGGGGAGGYREGKLSTDSYSASPLAATPCSALTLTAGTSYTVTVGAGGTGNAGPGGSKVGTSGSTSTFSTITSAGGGAGAGNANGVNGLDGGSGGGSTDNASPQSTGAGNTPPVSPPQGNPGGPYSAGGSMGGGGAGAAGTNAGGSPGGGNGGNGVASSITGSPVTRAGGGAGGGNPSTTGSGTAGTGGGSQAGTSPAPGSPSANATANTGGGSGGSNDSGGASSGNGGSGVVIIRYKFQ